MIDTEAWVKAAEDRFFNDGAAAVGAEACVEAIGMLSSEFEPMISVLEGGRWLSLSDADEAEEPSWNTPFLSTLDLIRGAFLSSGLSRRARK